MNYYYFLSELDEKWVTFFKNGKVYQSVFFMLSNYFNKLAYSFRDE